MVSVKLKKADASTYIEYFNTLPTWEGLTSRIRERFHILTQDIAVGYLDNSKDPVILTHDQGLQEYYKSLDQSSKIKFVVLDQQTLDCRASIIASWPSDFDLYELSNTVSLFCWVLGKSDADRIPFSVDIGKEKTVDGIKKKIKEEQKHTFAGIDSLALRLWKLSPPISSVDDAMLELIKSPEDVPGCINLNPVDSVETHFPSPPPAHIHIIVQLPTSSRKRSRSPEAARASKKIRTVVGPSLPIVSNGEPSAGEQGFPIIPVNIYVPRRDTVSALYQKLNQQRWIHVRGTPGSGKSVLANLLCHYINEQEPDTEVVLVHAWPQNREVETIHNTILILDEAQTTYGDQDFWSRFKNPGLEGMRVVAFASCGTSGSTGPDLSPIWLRMEQRVGLARLDCGDGIVIGLLFTAEEFNAFVRLRFHDRGFSDTFLDCVYDMTNGHVGACEDLMNMVIAHESYRHRVKSAEYTYAMFITGVSMPDISKAIYRGTVFSRGLPQARVLRENPHITALMSEVIKKGSIICDDDYLASDPKDDDNRKAALRKIFRSGWLHTEIRTDIDEILYTFASPLHRRCIDWKLNGSPFESRIIEPSLPEFALAVIQRVSRQSLKNEIGPKAQSISETQFQDEFYSACSKHASGSVSFPEFGTKNGRIDFFIRLKKWGVELLRDGNRLAQHARRFTEGEYGKWMERKWMSDYIIIDFRTQRPRTGHRDVDKLIYVVSVDDWNTIDVLDNEGRAFIRQLRLLNNS